MIEQLYLCGERQMELLRKEGEKDYKKLRAQNNFKILPKNRAPVPRCFHENILKTRLALCQTDFGAFRRKANR